MLGEYNYVIKVSGYPVCGRYDLVHLDSRQGIHTGRVY